MICYKDMTFCRFHESCVDGDKCGRAMTKEVLDGARDVGMPISQFCEEPECFDEGE